MLWSSVFLLTAVLLMLAGLALIFDAAFISSGCYEPKHGRAEGDACLARCTGLSWPCVTERHG